MKNCKPTKVKFKNLLVPLLLFILPITMLFILQKLFYTDMSAVMAIKRGSSAMQVWNGDTSLLDGKYYLTRDVNLMQKITIPQGNTVTLILNGFALIQAVDVACIEVEAGATLLIQDSMTAVPSSPEISVAENTILTNIDTTSPCILVQKNATLHVENITVAVNVTLQHASLISNTATFKNSEINDKLYKTEVYFKSSNAKMIKPRIENTFHILENSKVTMTSESQRKAMYFTPDAIMKVDASILRIDNTNGRGSNVKIYDLQVTGTKTVCEFINFTIVGMRGTNLQQSSILLQDIIVNTDIELHATNTKFTTQNTTLPAGCQIAFIGDNNHFYFVEEKVAGKYILQANRIVEFACDNKTIPIILQDMVEIEKFTYTQNTYLPKVPVKILNCIATTPNIHIQGQTIDGRDASHLQIQTLVLDCNTTAIFDENSILQNTKILVLQSDAELVAQGTLFINYKMESSVELATAVSLNFSASGSLENVKFIGDAKVEDFQEYIDKGQINFGTQEAPKVSQDLSKIKILLIVSLIINCILVWIGIIFLVKGKNKTQK